MGIDMPISANGQVELTSQEGNVEESTMVNSPMARHIQPESNTEDVKMVDSNSSDPVESLANDQTGVQGNENEANEQYT